MPPAVPVCLLLTSRVLKTVSAAASQYSAVAYRGSANRAGGFRVSSVRSLKKGVTCERAAQSIASEDMPKVVDNTEMREARSARKKKLKSYGPPATVKLQVLGSGAEGAPAALFVYTTNCSYLFNCGEGSQRLSAERRTRLVNLEHIFITHNTWRNVGGVLGALLTTNDMALPAITLHAPPGLSALFDATRSFIQIRGMSLTHNTAVHQDFTDTGLTVRAVPLYGADICRSEEEAEVQEAAPSVDYFAYERTGGKGRPVTPPHLLKSQREDAVPSEPPPERECSYAYICSLANRPGRLLLENCVEMGVPPGPLLGQLKAGQDVTLPGGKVVKSSDVTSPDEVGAQFAVVDLPSEDFLPSLADLNSSIDTSRLAAVVHFSAPSVMDSPVYKGWTDSLPRYVRHIVLNSAGAGHGSEAVHRQQYLLNTIDADVFPLLAEDTLDVQLHNDPPSKRQRMCADTPTGEATPTAEPEAAPPNGAPPPAAGEAEEAECGPVHPPAGWELCLRPPGKPDTSGIVPVQPDSYRAELAANASFAPHLDEYRRAVAALPASESSQNGAGDEVYPQTVFLGTGSSVPNKKRNTSGILINLSADHAMLMDCGEGTYGQMVRLLGKAESANVLRKLGVIYISHLHADHHIGLISILEARRRALGQHHSPCLLLAPGPIYSYLVTYHRSLAPLLDTFTLIANQRLLGSSSPLPSDLQSRLREAGLVDVATCRVLHCPQAFGIRIKASGRTVVYSGDTRPCEELVELGSGCDLLIHEATHEDALQDEAVLRAHSTASEAFGVADRMGARHLVLTHFSQRYATIPVLPEDAPDNAGVAYDNMVINFGHLPRLPLMLPPLKEAFSEYVDQCVERIVKRENRKQREAEVLEKNGT